MPSKKLKVESSKLKVKNARKATVKKSSTPKPKTVRSTTIKSGSARLRADVYNTQGKVVSKIGLPKEMAFSFLLLVATDSSLLHTYLQEVCHEVQIQRRKRK